MTRAAAAASSASPTTPSSNVALRRIMRHLRRSARHRYPATYGQNGHGARTAGKSPDPERPHRLADEMAPLVAHPCLVLRRRLGHREAGAAEHPEGELDQRVEGPVGQVPGPGQVADEPLDQPVGVVALALAPALPAERGGALQPDQAPVGRVAALPQVGAERLDRRVPRIRCRRGGRDRLHRAGFLKLQHGLEQRLLAGEVVVDGAPGHLARGCHVLQRGPGVAARGEQRGRLVEQCRPGGLRVHLTAALDLCHTLSIVTYTEYVTVAAYVRIATSGPGQCEGRW